MAFQKEVYMMFGEVEKQWFIGVIYNDLGMTKYHFTKDKEEAQKLLDKFIKKGYKDVTYR